MPSIIYFRENETYTQNDTVVVDRSTYDDYYCEGVNCGLLSHPAKCFVLSVNVKEEDIPILLYYVKCCFCQNHKIENNQYEESISKLDQLWTALIKDLSGFNLINSQLNICELRKEKIDILGELGSVLDLLETFNFEVLGLLDEPSAYRHINLIDKKRNWYIDSPSILFHLKRFHQSLKVFPNSLGRLKSKINAFIENKIQYWKIFENCNTADKFYHLSAFYYSHSKRLLERKRFALALIMVHRALDMYFTSIAIRESVISCRGHGLEYRSCPRDPITLSKTNELLCSETNLLIRSRRREQFLTQINKTRNYLSWTHYVYCVKKTEAQLAITEAKNVIKSLEGNNNWRQLVKQHSTIPKLKPEYLFDIEPSIDTFCYEKEIDSITL